MPFPAGILVPLPQMLQQSPLASGFLCPGGSPMVQHPPLVFPPHSWLYQVTNSRVGRHSPSAGTWRGHIKYLPRQKEASCSKQRDPFGEQASLARAGWRAAIYCYHLSLLFRASSSALSLECMASHFILISRCRLENSVFQSLCSHKSEQECRVL